CTVTRARRSSICSIVRPALTSNGLGGIPALRSCVLTRRAIPPDALGIESKRTLREAATAISGKLPVCDPFAPSRALWRRKSTDWHEITRFFGPCLLSVSPHSIWHLALQADRSL